VATAYQYDPLSRLGEHKLDFAGSADDLTSTFAYNPASQIASNTRSNDAYAWTSHGSGTTSTTANGLNQLASWVSTLAHDSKGNITTDGAYTYTYSSENLLTAFTNPAGTVQTASTFAYDPLMRLAVIDSTNAALDVQFGYDGQEMAYEGLSNGRTRRYVYGPGTDEPLVSYLSRATGTSRLWYQADERGSITRLSNDPAPPAASASSTNMAPAAPAGSATPANTGSAKPTSSTTAPGSTTRGWAGSCSRTRSATATG
jgi:hypothetical protein